MLFLIKFAASDVTFSTSLLHDELDALLRANGVEPRVAFDRNDEVDRRLHPFVTLQLANEEILQRVIQPAAFVYRAYELYAHAATLHDAVDVLARCPRSLLGTLLTTPGSTFRIDVDTVGFSLPQAAQHAARMHVAELLQPLDGVVRLKGPVDAAFAVIMDAEQSVPSRFRAEVGEQAASALPSLPPLVPPAASDMDALGSRASPPFSSDCCAACAVCTAADAARHALRRVYITRYVCDGGRKRVNDMQLRKRPYLGPTSLEPELALVMCNIAHARPGTLMLDPFVGTGSITVMAAACGAVTIGTDIDIRVFSGKQGQSVDTNFAQYGLGMPENIRTDASRAALRPVPMFDAMVTDPPYGVRAAARQMGVKDGVDPTIPDAVRSVHMPRTHVYDGDAVILDLLDTAAQRLVVGGRLVYLLPMARMHGGPCYIPQHACLRMYALSDQRLSLIMCRCIVGMEKVAEYDPTRGAEYREASAAHARAAGWLDTTAKQRMNALYDSWFALHKDALPSAKAALRGRHAAEGSSDEDDATHHQIEDHGDGSDRVMAADSASFDHLSRKQLARYTARLTRIAHVTAKLPSDLPVDAAAMSSPETEGKMREGEATKARKAQRQRGEVASFKNPNGRIPFDKHPTSVSVAATRALAVAAASERSKSSDPGAGSASAAVPLD